MSLIAEELTFAVLSVTKLKNIMVFLGFSKSISGSESCSIPLNLAIWRHYNVVLLQGVFQKCQKWPFFGTILSFLWKILKTGNIVSQISPWKQRLQKKQSIPWRSRQKMPCDGHQECIPRPILWGKIPRTKSAFFRCFEFFWKSERWGFCMENYTP